MKKSLFLLCLLAGYSTQLRAQVKIGDNPNSINSNSILELESSNKGFLPPRVALTNPDSTAPLSGTVTEGMLVYSLGGSLTDGYYFWNGSRWIQLGSESESAPILTRSNSDTLPKQTSFVLASGTITLTLPAITAADDGLAITVKNVGTHTDLVQMVPNGAALLDSFIMIPLPRWFAVTVVARNGSWYFKERTSLSSNTMEVNWAASWTTIGEALDFLNVYMSGPTVLRMGSGVFDVSETQIIDLPYSLTIEGTSFGTTTFAAASGLANKPMFQCSSECYFKQLVFDGSTLTNYGNNEGEDAIQLLTAGTYHEIKDCTFDHFNKAIHIKGGVELWFFENDVSNSVVSGVEIAAGADSGVFFKTSETDFLNCTKGISLVSGVAAKISILNSVFYNTNASDTGIVYLPASFTNFESMFITNCSWNNVGTFIGGFDFSRSDGRDANVFFENNAGEADKRPFCMISVTNNAMTTTVTNSGTWNKANWTNTSTETIKWTVSGNKITYQPVNRRSGWIILNGNLSINNNNRTISIGIVKNGVTTTVYGETALRVTSANQPFQFSTAIYLTDIQEGDYLEVYCTSSHSSEVITFQDIQWLTETR